MPNIAPCKVDKSHEFFRKNQKIGLNLIKQYLDNGELKRMYITRIGSITICAQHTDCQFCNLRDGLSCYNWMSLYIYILGLTIDGRLYFQLKHDKITPPILNSYSFIYENEIKATSSSAFSSLDKMHQIFVDNNYGKIWWDQHTCT